jgi:hypothetical protein
LLLFLTSPWFSCSWRNTARASFMRVRSRLSLFLGFRVDPPLSAFHPVPIHWGHGHSSDVVEPSFEQVAVLQRSAFFLTTITLRPFSPLFRLYSFPRDKAMNLFFEEMNRFDSFNDGNREDEVSRAITVWKKMIGAVRFCDFLLACASMRLMDAWGFALIKHASWRRAKSSDLVQRTVILVLS